MKRTVNAIEARRNLGELLEGVRYRGDEITIERAGKPMAMIVPIERYQKVLAARERMFALLEQLAPESLPLEEAEGIADEAVAWARRSRKGRGVKRTRTA